MAGAKYFSTLDATQGFLQIKLDEESSKLCTFGTPFGRNRFLRLPYGLSSAPEVFQEKMSQMFGNIEGVNVYNDDIIVSGRTLKEHNERLMQVLETAKQNDLKLNKDKCKFNVKTVTYMGHIISEAGMQADKTKIDAIKNMKTHRKTQKNCKFS